MIIQRHLLPQTWAADLDEQVCLQLSKPPG